MRRQPGVAGTLLALGAVTPRPPGSWSEAGPRARSDAANQFFTRRMAATTYAIARLICWMAPRRRAPSPTGTLPRCS